MLTISTSGKCPALSKHLRKELEETFGREYELFLDILAISRKKILDAGISHDKCRVLLNNLINSDILPLIKKGKQEEAESFADRYVAEATNKFPA